MRLYIKLLNNAARHHRMAKTSVCWDFQHVWMELEMLILATYACEGQGRQIASNRCEVQ